ncbi:LysR substrate-binding domain-containing protein [uncultured Paenalcaligenes sp.]|uniref:LysR substrate-binding domain-containing protein n=1 Tax=uncultured Paenalcaligenes sp. TaxID=1588925 RepID=UPI002637EAC4|nr:LysR substrate-binding domain-containing protein [uncultured Paenalcaligenes sp.]
MADLPPLRALQIFETVGHSQNIQDAARRLGISAGAVSQQLQLLEQHLKAALFFKEGRRLQLTAAGIDFHQRTTEAFELLRDAQTQLMLDQQQRTLHLSALPSFLNDWLVPRLRSWQAEQAPAIGLHLHGSHHEPDYANERIDFRFTYAQSVPQSLHWVALFTDEVLPVCHPDLLQNQLVRQPKDLAQLPLINVDWQPRFSSPPTWSEWFKHYATEQIEIPAATQSFSLSHQALDAVRQGIGIMLAQRSYIEQDLQAGLLCAPFSHASLPLAWPYVMTWQPSVFNKPHARDFHRFILQQKAAVEYVYKTNG